MRLRLSVLVLVVAAALAAPAGAHAAEVLFGPEDGVRATTVAGDKLVIHFTGRSAKALRRVRGARAEVNCLTLAPNDGLIHGAGDTHYVSRSARIPRRGTRLVVRSVRRADVCVATAERREREVIATAVLTEAGRLYTDESARAGMIFVGMGIASDLADRAGGTAWPPADAMITAGEGMIVALADPTATPPLDKIGYWTDGARHLVLAVATVAGRRLYYEELDAETVRTNMFSSGSAFSF